VPLARTYDAAIGKVVTTARDAYLDRLSRWSDIQEYLPFLFETAASYPQVRVLELGARLGNSTLAFLAAAEVVHGSVVSVDLDRVTGERDGMHRWQNHPGWTFIQGDDMQPAVRAQLPAECDVLFIDTSHEYEHTLDECRAYVPRVAPGGVALLHDTKLMAWPGYDWQGEVAPVWQALDDYCAETGLSWENLPGEYGLGVIRS
jgi:predicted O-methyltransferase YrrM